MPNFDDFTSALHHAQNHHGSEDPSLFNKAVSFLQNNKDEYADPSRYEVDEDHAIRSHQAMYGGGGGDGEVHDSRSVGAGAAMQAVKLFTSGGAQDGGMDMNKLIGLAMANAGQLWDEKASSGGNMVCY